MMMTRFILTLFIGLVVSLGALVSGTGAVLASQIIWEGYQTQKFNFTGVKRKKIQITVEGVSVDGVFLSPDKRSNEEVCA